MKMKQSIKKHKILTEMQNLPNKIKKELYLYRSKILEEDGHKKDQAESDFFMSLAFILSTACEDMGITKVELLKAHDSYKKKLGKK